MLPVVVAGTRAPANLMVDPPLGSRARRIKSRLGRIWIPHRWLPRLAKQKSCRLNPLTSVSFSVLSSFFFPCLLQQAKLICFGWQDYPCLARSGEAME